MRSTPKHKAPKAQSADTQPPLFFVANGVLSAISDNVFVATIYINEVKAALDNGLITRQEFDNLAVAINTGTNIPSVATPNGQAHARHLGIHGCRLKPRTKVTERKLQQPLGRST